MASGSQWWCYHVPPLDPQKHADPPENHDNHDNVDNDNHGNDDHDDDGHDKDDHEYDDASKTFATHIIDMIIGSSFRR